MSVVTWEKKDRTAVISMNNGANTQNLIFAQELNRCLDEAIEDTEITAIVLTSTDPKSFPRAWMFSGWVARLPMANSMTSKDSCTA